MVKILSEESGGFYHRFLRADGGFIYFYVKDIENGLINPICNSDPSSCLLKRTGRVVCRRGRFHSQQIVAEGPENKPS